MKVRWVADAKQDRADIIDYIAVENPRAALKMDDLFGEAADTVWVMTLVHTARTWPPVKD